MIWAFEWNQIQMGILIWIDIQGHFMKYQK